MKNNDTDTIMIAAFQNALRQGDEQEIKDFLESDLVDINYQFANGLNALHYAVQRKNFPITEFLLSSNIDIDAIDIYQRTPLMMAIENQDLDMLKILITAGANIDIVTKQGSTMHIAIINKFIEGLKFLLQKKVKLDSTDKNNFNIFHLIVKENNIEIAEVLLQIIPQNKFIEILNQKENICTGFYDQNEEEEKAELTPVEFAAIQNNHQLIEKFICAYPKEEIESIKINLKQKYAEYNTNKNNINAFNIFIDQINTRDESKNFVGPLITSPSFTSKTKDPSRKRDISHVEKLTYDNNVNNSDHKRTKLIP